MIDPKPALLTPAAIHEDLIALERMIEDRFAYAHANDVDPSDALDDIRHRTRGGASVNAFGLMIHAVLGRYIDGHLRVSPYTLAEGGLPALLETVGDRVVAVLPDRSGFVAESAPYLRAIDDVPLEHWLAAAADIVPRGTKEYVRFRSLRHLYDVQHWRTVLGLPRDAKVTLQLENEDASRTVVIEAAVRPEPATFAPWPNQPSRLLDGGIGYVRVPRMRDEVADHVRMIMPTLARTRGLIVDVRDNTGGRRSPLQALHAFLLRPDEDAVVGSVAAYRLWEGFSDDHLAQRSMYRAASEAFDPKERAVVREFGAGFQPERDLRHEGFSEWHYLVLGKHAPFHYAAPVVVLMNEKCFSASDIFLGAIRLRPNVTLMGVPSSGGSAFGIHHTLPKSGVEVRLGSMISFQPDGTLYDTRGIQPDVRVEPVATDFVRGGGDSTLRRAVEWLS